MKEYRVKLWLSNEDGREEYMEADTMEHAIELYDSFGGRAKIQQWSERRHEYIDVPWPI